MKRQKRDHPDLFILRHGQTEWNKQGRYQGQSDSPLTELGRQQALAQNRILSTCPNVPDRAFVSPLGRTVETARLALGNQVQTTHDDRLREIAFGDWEGRTRMDISHELGTPLDGRAWYFDSPGGETFDRLQARVSAFLDDLTAPAIVVTHGVTSTMLRGLCMGLDKADMLALPIKQGCVFHLGAGDEAILR